MASVGHLLDNHPSSHPHGASSGQCKSDFISDISKALSTLLLLLAVSFARLAVTSFQAASEFPLLLPLVALPARYVFNDQLTPWATCPPPEPSQLATAATLEFVSI